MTNRTSVYVLSLAAQVRKLQTDLNRMKGERAQEMVLKQLELLRMKLR